MISYRLVQKTKVIEGIHSIRQLPKLCKEMSYRKPFLVFDQGIAKVGIAGQIIKLLDEAGIESITYDKITPDPTSNLVDEGAAICKKEHCDCIVAIGGGSTMDAAKGMNVMRVNEGKILDFVGKEENMHPAEGLICIPTTSGTGSELSNWIVITDLEEGSKHPINVKNSMSEYAILDPTLTLGVPAQVTAFTGLDVFSHAFEAYTSNLCNPMTDLICEKLMEDIICWLPKAVKDGSNLQAREKMMVCASYGGFLLVDCLVHIGHCIAHEIGAQFHIPHGAACAYAFPPMVYHIAKDRTEKIRYVGELFGVHYSGEEGAEEIAEELVKAYVAFRDETLGLRDISSYEPDLKQVNLEMADHILQDPITSMTPTPVHMEDVLVMLYRIFIPQD